MVPRLELDAWIVNAARAAGARLLEGRRAAGIERDADGVSLLVNEGRSTRRVRTRMVIGADGSTSRAAEWLRGRPLDKRRRMIAVRAYYDGVEGPADRADLYFAERSFPGYFWIFPIGGGRANVGIGTVLRTAPPSAEHLRDLLLALVRDDPAIARRLGGARLDGKVVGWPLTTFDHRLPVVGDRMVLVGDAAGLINPLNGEGIQYALLSGRWAAHVVAQALRHGDCSAASLSPYARTVAHSLRYDMALAQMVVELIRNRSLNAVWLRSLQVLAARARADPGYSRIAGGVLAGLLPASDLVSRRVLLGSLEQTANIFDAGSLLDGTQRLLRDSLRHPGTRSPGLPASRPRRRRCSPAPPRGRGRTPRPPRHRPRSGPPRLRDRTPRGPPPVIPTAGPAHDAELVARDPVEARATCSRRSSGSSPRRRPATGRSTTCSPTIPSARARASVRRSASRPVVRSAAAPSRPSSRPPPSSCSTTRSWSTTTSRTARSSGAGRSRCSRSTAPRSRSTSATPRTSWRSDLLLDNVETLGVRKALLVFREVERMARESAEGQAIELAGSADGRSTSTTTTTCAWPTRRPAGTPSSRRSVWASSAAPAGAGAPLDDELRPLIELGFLAGIAFQIHDDLLNLEADEILYGKETERRPVGGQAHGHAPPLHAHRAKPRARARRLRVLRTSRARKDRRRRRVAARRDARAGSLEHGRRLAVEYSERALELLRAR